jgi:hypothetical protein
MDEDDVQTCFSWMERKGLTDLRSSSLMQLDTIGLHGALMTFGSSSLRNILTSSAACDTV